MVFSLMARAHFSGRLSRRRVLFWMEGFGLNSKEGKEGERNRWEHVGQKKRIFKDNNKKDSAKITECAESHWGTPSSVTSGTIFDHLPENLSRNALRNDESDESLKVWTNIPPDLDEKVADIMGIIQQKAGVIRHEPQVDMLPYLRNGFVNQKEFEFINEFQATSSQEDRDNLLTKHKGEVFQTITDVIRKICVSRDIKKLLVLLDDMLWEDLTRLEVFNSEVEEAWKIFQELIHINDDFIKHLASRIMIKLLRGHPSCPKPTVEDLWFFLSWLKKGIRADNEYLQSVARCLQELLQVDEYREAFMSLNGILKIVNLLSDVPKPQTQYQFCFCLWVTSFNPYLADRLNRYDTIPIMVNLLQSCPSEISKLPRIIFATFRNLLEKPKDQTARQNNALLMIQCKLLTYMDVLETGIDSSEDPEYQEDFEFIQTTLETYVAELSSFDEYLLELTSGRLEWSIVHTSKKFWIKNAERLNEEGHRLLKILLDMLKNSQENLILCIAAHDVGEYMRHYPRGKRVVRGLGGKDSLVRLLSHKNPEVKYHVLKCLQTLMLDHYEITDNFGKRASQTWNPEIDFGL